MVSEPDISMEQHEVVPSVRKQKKQGIQTEIAKSRGEKFNVTATVARDPDRPRFMLSAAT